MSANKSRKEHKAYRHYYRKKKDSPRRDVCEFCTIDASAEQFISESKHFKVIQNIFPYSLWDDYGVDDHVLLIPKRHIEHLGDLKTPEMTDFFEMLRKYEDQGYNLFARAPKSKQKSIPHQHTHLMKPSDQKTRVLFHVRKPYLRIWF